MTKVYIRCYFAQLISDFMIEQSKSDGEEVVILKVLEGVDYCLVIMAQWIAHRTSNPGVVGSSPTGDALFAPAKSH